jgi:hypothetical protein
MAGKGKHKNAAKEDIVITPGGPRAKKLVHRVGASEAVNFGAGGRGIVISDHQSRIEEASPTLAKNLVLTPGGFRHRDLVRRVEPGQGLRAINGQMRLLNLATRKLIDLPQVSALEGVVPELGSGWIAYAYWNNGSGNQISSFRTTWEVPPAPIPQPLSPGEQVPFQTIFLFNGIVNNGDNYGILQPVLQWGPSAAGGGSFWSVASWYVTSGGQAFHTELVPVDVGDKLVGVMTLTGQSGGLFGYTSEFQGIAGTSLPVQNIAELVWCNETLEAYGILECGNYPNAQWTEFRDIEIKTGRITPTVNWTPENKVTDCGQHAVVAINSGSGGKVVIHYNNIAATQLDLSHFAKFVQVLFGVSNGGGGFVILPNGQIIHIPPHGPPDPILRLTAEVVTELARALAIHEIARGSTHVETRDAMAKMSLEMTARALERALQVAREELS